MMGNIKYTRFFEKEDNNNIVEEIKKFFKPTKDIQYDPEELKKGIKVEHEHVSNDVIAELIAKHHLSESGGKKYYSWLNWMEELMKKYDTPDEYEGKK